VERQARRAGAPWFKGVQGRVTALGGSKTPRQFGGDPAIPTCRWPPRSLAAQFKAIGKVRGQKGPKPASAEGSWRSAPQCTDPELTPRSWRRNDWPVAAVAGA